MVDIQTPKKTTLDFEQKAERNTRRVVHQDTEKIMLTMSVMGGDLKDKQRRNPRASPMCQQRSFVDSSI